MARTGSPVPGLGAELRALGPGPLALTGLGVLAAVAGGVAVGLARPGPAWGLTYLAAVAAVGVVAWTAVSRRAGRRLAGHLRRQGVLSAADWTGYAVLGPVRPDGTWDPAPEGWLSGAGRTAAGLLAVDARSARFFPTPLSTARGVAPLEVPLRALSGASVVAQGLGGVVHLHLPQGAGHRFALAARPAGLAARLRAAGVRVDRTPP